MKIKKLLLVLFGVLCLIVGSFAFTAQAQVATNVSWYVLPTTLPDTIHLEFGTARDNWLTSLSMGVNPTTGSRLTGPTAIEVKSVFDVRDICVSTNAGTNLWLGVFAPPAPHATMTGSREYATALGIAVGGQMNIDGIGYRALCEKIPLLNNQSSFAGLSYSVSRIGIRKGVDGVLFTADDQILKNGEPGTSLVDAVVLIGARIGAIANNQVNIDDINTLVTTNGSRVTFEYTFNGSAKGVFGTMLYQSGAIPNNTNHVELFNLPTGKLFSLVGSPGSPAFHYKWTRNAKQPFASWSTANATATEGSSAFVPYVGDSGTNVAYVNAPTNGFIIYYGGATPQQQIAILSQNLRVSRLFSQVPQATDDLDQDR